MTIEKNFEASRKSHIALSDNRHNYVHPSASLASQTSFGKQPWCAQVLSLLSELHYKVNDHNYGVAFDDIPQKTYKVALFLYEHGSKVQIIH